MTAPPAHRSTTAHLQAVYPFVSAGGLAGRGPLIGRDLLGGPFHFDPWFLYEAGALTNPNSVVLGQIGRGKSTFVKTFIFRQIAFGRRAWIVDPKGEYERLARACQSVPVRLAPGGTVCLNPLDAPAGCDGAEAVRGRAGLTASLVASSLGRALEPAERTAVELSVAGACRRSASPTLSDVVRALLEPELDLARSVGTDRSGLAADGRTVALELRRLVEGDLRGMFDGPTTIGIDLDGGLVVLDLSDVFNSPALPLLMTCAAAWLQTILRADRSVKRLIVVDEAWAILRNLPTARWLQTTFKLSRAMGVANLAVVHRLSDLTAAGADGSAEQRLAEGLLADSEIRVVFGQSPSEAVATAGLLGLSRAEGELVSRLPRGVALWKVGERSFVVEHLLGRREATLTDTDAAMLSEP